jgi:hypothetical protein
VTSRALDELPRELNADHSWPAFPVALEETEHNKAIVREAFDALFNRRDYDAAERFWAEDVAARWNDRLRAIKRIAEAEHQKRSQ